MTKRSLLAIRHIGFEDLGSVEHPFRMAGYDIEFVDEQSGMSEISIL